MKDESVAPPPRRHDSLTIEMIELDKSPDEEKSTSGSVAGTLTYCRTSAKQSELKNPGSPSKQALMNLWLVAIMGGFIAIICLSAGRFGVEEEGIHWHSIGVGAPFAMGLKGDPIYLQVRLLLPPWEAQETQLRSEILIEGPTIGLRRQLKRQRLPESVDRFRELLGGGVAVGSMGSAIRKRTRSLLSAENPAVPHVPPALKVYVAQQVQLQASSSVAANATKLKDPVVWMPITFYSTCKFLSAKASVCQLVWQDVTRVNSSQPAVLIVELPAGQVAIQVAAEIHVNQMGSFGKVKEWMALIILILVLLAMALDIAHRTLIAFVGSFCMLGLLLVANEAPTIDEVMTWVDFGTLGLLFGMMLIVGQIQKTGVFEVMCASCLRASKGNLLILTILLCLITAFVSAWLDNVTTMLLMAPLTMVLFEKANRSPVPMLMAQAMLSNIGGAATLIGDPPNIIIGLELADVIGFIDFLNHLGPGVLAATPVCILVLVLMYPKDLRGKIEGFSDIRVIFDACHIKDWKLFWRTTYVTGGVIIAFLLQPVTKLNPAWVALIGATIITVVVEYKELHAVIQMVEWDMLLFFCAMFIMVEGAVELGLINKIAQLLELIINTAPESKREIAAIQVILWFSAFFSAILDNIPYTITMIPVIEMLAANNSSLDLTILAWALAFGACFGGNGTLIGASANIVTSGLAEKRGHPMGFMTWLKAGIPVTIASVAVANVYMLLRYCL